MEASVITGSPAFAGDDGLYMASSRHDLGILRKNQTASGVLDLTFAFRKRVARWLANVKSTPLAFSPDKSLTGVQRQRTGLFVLVAAIGDSMRFDDISRHARAYRRNKQSRNWHR
jgi:hypothetical protein